jgi:hypothetical protein
MAKIWGELTVIGPTFFDKDNTFSPYLSSFTQTSVLLSCED